ncbi:aldo/keto reductase [Levilactobacillus zymae]|uniref:Oxidoreductase of aldo/keto reductase family, subgroup 1 n=1 Tax=Levilactobacillus zymae TaxID=267363 RepID=A0A1Y6JYW4_9LACO|nr:aldo/keto reductase [Levilactobacillus zymae]SMS14331.1 oxidoreductase of aldo/keto reductase family, subgroup 1 [Levilactobacillus zymae]
MTNLTTDYRLNTGARIPKMGLRTQQLPVSRTRQLVLAALRLGYRQLDLTLPATNTAQVGQAIRESGLRRSTIFVTVQLAPTVALAAIRPTVTSALKCLGLSTVDLCVWTAPPCTPQSNQGRFLAWRNLEELTRAGLVRAIGVAGLTLPDLQNLWRHATVPPAVVQISGLIGRSLGQLWPFARAHHLLIAAPVVVEKPVRNRDVRLMAEKYGVSAAQLTVRFCVQRGILPLLAARTPAQLATDTRLAGPLSVNDLHRLATLRNPTENFW